MLVSSWPGEFVAGTSSTLLHMSDPPHFHAKDNSVRGNLTKGKDYFRDDTVLDFMEFRLRNEIFRITPM
jgi:hypothetical protein